MRKPVKVPRPTPRVQWANVTRCDGAVRRVLLVNFVRVNADALIRKVVS